jgi:hypothetical protein
MDCSSKLMQCKSNLDISMPTAYFVRLSVLGTDGLKSSLSFHVIEASTKTLILTDEYNVPLRNLQGVRKFSKHRQSGNIVLFYSFYYFGRLYRGILANATACFELFV